MLKKIFIFILFISVVTNNAQAQKTDFGHNAKIGKYAPVNNIKIYYEIYGKGAPLLMIHGNGGDISNFQKQIPFFSKYYKVISVDSRMQGKSGGSTDSLSYDMMADDFCALLDYLKIDSAYVLGWSDGGINGLIMAMRCPKKVIALAITGANITPDSSAFSNADINSMKDFVANNKTATKKEITLNKMMIDQPNITEEQLGKIKCPVLVMAGDHDVIKPAHTIRIFQSIPNAQLCIFPDSHHGVCQQHPVLFNKTVYNFYKKVLAK